VDDYKRLLRYVYVGDVFVNERLIAEGFAEAKVFPPNTAFAKNFADLEAAAKSFNQGLWSACSR